MLVMVGAETADPLSVPASPVAMVPLELDALELLEAEEDDEDEEDEVLDPLELLPAPIALPDEELEPLEGPIPEGSVASSSVLTVVAQARTTPKPRAPKARYFMRAI